jgi:hypothetical protein
MRLVDGDSNTTEAAHQTAGVSSGQGGIRTHETREGLPVFKTGAFNRSATCPEASVVNGWHRAMRKIAWFARWRHAERTLANSRAHCERTVKANAFGGAVSTSLLSGRLGLAVMGGYLSPAATRHTDLESLTICRSTTHGNRWLPRAFIR